MTPTRRLVLVRAPATASFSSGAFTQAGGKKSGAKVD
jgi:hypothetical protein